MKTSYICNQNPTHYEKVTPFHNLFVFLFDSL